MNTAPTPTATRIDPSIDLDKIRHECQALVKSRAKVSAGMATIPVPFLDVAVDATLLTKLLPEISERFGLIAKTSDAAYIDSKDSRFKSFKDSILSFGGLVAARGLAKKAIQGFGMRFVSKQVSKYIPLGGSMVAATMSYMVFKKIAFNHIEECYQLAKKLQKNPQTQTSKANDA